MRTKLFTLILTLLLITSAHVSIAQICWCTFLHFNVEILNRGSLYERRVSTFIPSSSNTLVMSVEECQNLNGTVVGTPLSQTDYHEKMNQLIGSINSLSSSINNLTSYIDIQNEMIRTEVIRSLDSLDGRLLTELGQELDRIKQEVSTMKNNSNGRK